jgi:hypothetical protein
VQHVFEPLSLPMRTGVPPSLDRLNKLVSQEVRRWPSWGSYSFPTKPL